MTISPVLRLTGSYLLLAALCLVAPATHGASFDCRLAKSAVELEVCGDEGLSALDDTLEREYRSALSRASGDARRVLRGEQRDWIRRRDSCSSPRKPCLVREYNDRIQTLRASTNASKVVIQFPPYPNVWTWVPKTPPTTWLSFISLRRLATGDVLVAVVDRTSEETPHTEVAAFFGRQSFATVGSAMGGQFKPADDKQSISLGENRGVRAHLNGIDSCSRGIDDFIRIDEGSGRSAVSRTILVLLDHARTSRTLSCDGQDDRGFSYRVAPIYGRLLALEDGTFLVTDATSGLVMRFTDTFATESELLGKRFFVVEQGFLATELKKYTATPGGKIDWPAFQRGLISWATSLSK